jgi:hypothetical protein
LTLSAAKETADLAEGGNPMRLSLRAPTHATVVSYLALFVALGGTAYAATGGNFILGHANKANQASSLTNTGAGPALTLATKKGSTPPLAVSNGTKITNLNADKLDGLSSSAFARTSTFRTLSFHASSSLTPTQHKLGTVLGDTISADCRVFGNNDVQLRVYLQTSDGSWSVGYGSMINDGGTLKTDSNSTTAPAGTYSTPTQIDFLSALTNANGGGLPYRYSGHVDLVQLAPVKGHLVVHETAETSDHTCTLWVQSSPSS